MINKAFQRQKNIASFKLQSSPIMLQLSGL